MRTGWYNINSTGTIARSHSKPGELKNKENAK